MRRRKGSPTAQVPPVTVEQNRFPGLGGLDSLSYAGFFRTLLGNVLFNFREPVIRLRQSDQQMLLAALRGATDAELATELGVTVSAVKARWRSTFASVAAAMPGLVRDESDNECRGSQKRHRVLAYVRTHPEELRPFDWKARGINGKARRS